MSMMNMMTIPDNGNARILIVDDDRQMRLLAGEVLAQGGFSVAEASNGEEALQQVASVGCDLILLDVVMPKLDGFATCERVRQMPNGSRLPIVMMTGCDDPASIQRAFDAGATDFITKPVLWPILNQRVNYILRANAALRELAWRTEFQRVLIDSIPVPISIEDAKGCLLFHNQAFASLLKGSCLDTRLQISPESAATFGPTGQLVYPAKIRMDNDEARSVILHQAFFTPPNADEATIISVILDVTEREQAEQALRQSQAQLEAIIQSTADGILAVDQQGHVLLTNSRFLDLWQIPSSMTGSEDADLLQFVLDQLVDSAAFLDRVQQLYRSQDQSFDTLHLKDGRIFERLSQPLLQDGQMTGRVWTFQDVTQRQQAEQEIFFRANYDSLTGLPNRSQLHERLDQAIKQARRLGVQVGLLFIDLDRFKQVNDTLGHAVGDLLLCQVAERLKTCVRETDTVSRYSGDEFVLMLPNMASSWDACIVAEKIISQMAEAFNLSGHVIRITASIGIASYPDHGPDVTHLLRHADLAMYKAKTVGRNTYRNYEAAMTDQLMQQLSLEADLRLAVEREELIVYYQPIMNVRSGQLAGAEALVRWRHPQRGLVSPTEFIPMAEETGLIREISDWVLERVCQTIKQWQQIGVQVPVSINLSSVQILRGLTVEAVRKLLQRHDMRPESLAFEITESVLLTDSLQTQHWLENIRAMGIRVDIDDFGTGYSSLSYLRRFPVDRIKIDRSFVSNMVTDLSDRALVKAILAMASTLCLEVVAEGVEDPDQLALLSHLGCKYAQGFHFSRPVPDIEFVKFAQQRAQAPCRLRSVAQ